MRKSSRRSDQRMPAARHRTAAQMATFHACVVDEDLAPRPGQRHVAGERAIDLQRESTAAVHIRLMEVGAQHGVQQTAQAPQDAIVIGAFDRVEQFVPSGIEALLGLCIAQQCGIEAAMEQIDQDTCGNRIRGERAHDRQLAERKSDLPAPFEHRAQQPRVAPADAGGEHEAVETVGLGALVPHRLERREHVRAARIDVDRPAIRRLERQRLQHHGTQAAGRERCRHFLDHAQAERFDQRTMSDSATASFGW